MSADAEAAAAADDADVDADAAAAVSGGGNLCFCFKSRVTVGFCGRAMPCVNYFLFNARDNRNCERIFVI